MKYTEASVQVIKLENEDVVTAVVSASEAAVTAAIADIFGVTLGPQNLQKVLDKYADAGGHGIAGLAQLLTDHYDDNFDTVEKENQWNHIAKQINDVKEHCDIPGLSYSNDSEDDSFDSEW